VAITAVSSIGFLGFLIGPPLIGVIAGTFSLRVSFALIACIGVLVTVITYYSIEPLHNDVPENLQQA
jgi:MFS family permease